MATVIDYQPSDLRCASTIESVGFQDVSASFQELVVNVSNDIRAGDHQQIIIAPQLMMVILVSLTPEVLLSQPR